MRRTRNTLLTLLAALWVLAPASPATAAPKDVAVLGSDGELYRVIPTVSDSGNPFLELHVQRPDGIGEVVTVPGTEGFEVESSPYLLYENASRTLFLTWEESLNVLHQRIRVIGHQHGQWTEVIEVATDPYALKGKPSLAATRDTFVMPRLDGGDETITRSILHVTWVEQGHESPMIAYAPVVLLDGRYIGHHQIVDLTAVMGTEAPNPTDLWQATPPSVAVADDNHSVIFGFVHPDSGQVTSVRLTILSGELSVIADELRNHLIDFGARHDWQSPEGLRRLADELRNHLIDFGHHLDPQILRSIADDLRNHLIDFGAQYESTEIRRMAGDLRNHLIDFGFRVEERGLRRTAASQSSFATIDFEASVDPSGERRPVAQIAQLRAVKTWPRPAEATPESTLLLSGSGAETLLTWQEDGRVFYRETARGEWGPVLHLPGGNGLRSEDKLTVLQNRVRHR